MNWSDSLTDVGIDVIQDDSGNFVEEDVDSGIGVFRTHWSNLQLPTPSARARQILFWRPF